MEFSVGDEFFTMAGTRIKIVRITDNFVLVHNWFSGNWVPNGNPFRIETLRNEVARKYLIPYTKAAWILYGFNN